MRHFLLALLGSVSALRVPAVSGSLSRRALLGSAAALAPSAAFAEITSGKTGNDDYLEELPPKAKQAYLQYLPQLQLDSDYFVFELMPLLSQPGKWDQIGEITASTDIGSAASVSRLDREFITPMRILALAFPPDLGGDEMQASVDSFQKSMFQLSRLARKGATTGNTADPSSAEVKAVMGSWDAGRVALNSFFDSVNAGTGAKRLVAIPPGGKGYPRSQQLYSQLKKDAALCRNRGGEALAGIWGQLMVYGTVPTVKPCGNAAEAFYSQGL